MTRKTISDSVRLFHQKNTEKIGLRVYFFQSFPPAVRSLWRRSTLRSLAATLYLLPFLSTIVTLWSMSRPAAGSVTLLHITDCHLFGGEHARLRSGVQPYFSLRSVIKYAKLLSPSPSAVVLTGDFSQDSSAESYHHVGKLCREAFTQTPLLYTPGNHEDLATLNEVLAAYDCQGSNGHGAPHQVMLGNWQVFLLSTHVPGKIYGGVANSDLRWLQQHLTSGSAPAVVALHHPPIPPNPRTEDNLWTENCLQDSEAFLNAIRSERVKLVLHGHLHADSMQKIPSTHCTQLGTPSTCHQYDPTTGWGSGAVPNLGPGFRILSLHDDGSWETEVVWVDSGAEGTEGEG